jgi:hypothetical protein
VVAYSEVATTRGSQMFIRAIEILVIADFVLFLVCGLAILRLTRYIQNVSDALSRIENISLEIKKVESIAERLERIEEAVDRIDDKFEELIDVINEKEEALSCILNDPTVSTVDVAKDLDDESGFWSFKSA